MTTMGQAIDDAIKQHLEKYPGSEVYAAEVSASKNEPGHWWVEVQAAHFCERLNYYVKRCKSTTI